MVPSEKTSLNPLVNPPPPKLRLLARVSPQEKLFVPTPLTSAFEGRGLTNTADAVPEKSTGSGCPNAMAGSERSPKQTAEATA
jgi:hypothetical protein